MTAIVSVRIEGLKAIAAELGLQRPGTVVKLAARARDPLPLMRWNTEVWADLERLRAWRARNRAERSRRRNPGLPVVEGLVVIAEALRRSVRHVRAYASRAFDPLPVHGIGTRRPWIYESALRDWFARQAEPYQAQLRPRHHRRRGPRA